MNPGSIACVLSLALITACGVNSEASTTAALMAVSALPPIGKLCTADSPDFEGYRYSEHIAHCHRNVSQELKTAVAARYNVPRSEWTLYEFDHYIPLNAGGANDIDNLWPEPLEEAKKKDVLELKIFEELSAGTLTQADAIAEIKAWHP